MSSVSRFLCIHGHFYQPPRENPFTGRAEPQPSAHPYEDWNQRIADECYAANLHARVVSRDGMSGRTRNNYQLISSDFGPTLLRWLEVNDPDTYQAVIEADRASAARFGGHGSVMAQGYNHSILPLCNSRDKRTQIRWGIADFAHRFNRLPHGMWLPETAVDMETLDLLAEAGIVFTILEPSQAEAVRGPDEEWLDVSDGSVDIRHPYRVDLPGGGHIAVFFYNGPLSREIAFEGLLDDGHVFAQRLAGSLGAGAGPLLGSVATDGESYGHHHPHGEVALATALDVLESDADVRLTNYGEYLALHPPERQARIVENTSWSCAHGVERWRSDCGCCTGLHPEWSQRWRAPMRDSLDWLRDRLAGHFEERGSDLSSDPWAARDAYISVVLGGPIAGFLDTHSHPELDDEGRSQMLALLEIQRHAMVMYTSCGWFFDDISGIEGVVVLRHAGKAIQLAEDVFGLDLEEDFMDRLAAAPSNVDGVGSGRDVYEAEIRPYRADLTA